jgi:hypothetical protein
MNASRRLQEVLLKLKVIQGYQERIYIRKEIEQTPLLITEETR